MGKQGAAALPVASHLRWAITLLWQRTLGFESNLKVCASRQMLDARMSWTAENRAHTDSRGLAKAKVPCPTPAASRQSTTPTAPPTPSWRTTACCGSASGTPRPSAGTRGRWCPGPSAATSCRRSTWTTSGRRAIAAAATWARPRRWCSPGGWGTAAAPRCWPRSGAGTATGSCSGVRRRC